MAPDITEPDYKALFRGLRQGGDAIDSARGFRWVSGLARRLLTWGGFGVASRYIMVRMWGLVVVRTCRRFRLEPGSPGNVVVGGAPGVNVLASGIAV